MTKKETIIQAATELFAEKGYRETTTSDIRKKAKVAQGTLFYHFSNKEGILLHIFGELIHNYLQEIKAFSLEQYTGIEGLRQYTLLCDQFRKEQGKSLVFILPNFVPSLLSQNEETKKIFREYFETSITLLQGLIERGIADGTVRPVEPHTTAHFFFAISTGINRHMTLPAIKSPDLLETCLEFLETALKPE